MSDRQTYWQKIKNILRLREGWMSDKMDEQITIKLTKRQVHQLLGILEFGEEQNFPQADYFSRIIPRQAFSMSEEEIDRLVAIDEEEADLHLGA